MGIRHRRRLKKRPNMGDYRGFIIMRGPTGQYKDWLSHFDVIMKPNEGTPAIWWGEWKEVEITKDGDIVWLDKYCSHTNKMPHGALCNSCFMRDEKCMDCGKRFYHLGEYK